MSLTPWKRSWCQERLMAGRKGNDRGWDGWMASLTRWTWVWVNSGSWWWTGRPGVLRSMGSQRAGHDWATELNWVIKNLPAIARDTGAYPFCRSSWSRNQAWVSCTTGRFFTSWATREAPYDICIFIYVAQIVKSLPASVGDARDTGLIPVLERPPE